jgi:aryl-alcohol dehydrogenase-like predicted oxidoreductase
MKRAPAPPNVAHAAVFTRLPVLAKSWELLTGGMSRNRIANMAEDDWRKHVQRFHEPELSRSLGIADRLVAIAERHDTVPGAVIAWALCNPAVDGAIVGFRRRTRSIR